MYFVGLKHLDSNFYSNFYSVSSKLINRLQPAIYSSSSSFVGVICSDNTLIVMSLTTTFLRKIVLNKEMLGQWWVNVLNDDCEVNNNIVSLGLLFVLYD
jgi:hypothetical protein